VLIDLVLVLKKKNPGAPSLNPNFGQDILTMVHISSVFMHLCSTAGPSTFIHSAEFDGNWGTRILSILDLWFSNAGFVLHHFD
jgi:hypothetical protein